MDECHKIRAFGSGATRTDDPERLDYEGFLSPLVLQRYAQFMHKHRKQADGELRDSDNWQKGIPLLEYMKSKWRHFMSTWLYIREYGDTDIEEVLCAEMFNTMGILHEILKGVKDAGSQPKQDSPCERALEAMSERKDGFLKDVSPKPKQEPEVKSSDFPCRI